jgi:hypothetical protein
MIASLLSSFLSAWLIWVMIYWAYRYYPIIPHREFEIVQDMRDRIACNSIIDHDDLLTVDDSPLFMNVLRALDFLYCTVVPSLITVGILYLWSG